MNIEMIFDKAVNESVNTVMADYGFIVKKTSDWRIYYTESTLWEIYIAYSYECINVAMRLISEAKEAPKLYTLPRHLTIQSIVHPVSISKDIVDLFRILEVLAPEVKEVDSYPRRLKSKRMIRPEIERQLRLITDYCKPLLEGDLAQWSVVRECERHGYGKTQKDNETWQEYINRLREWAVSALRRRDYWKADELYGWIKLIGGRLSLRERLLWYRAKRYTFRLY